MAFNPSKEVAIARDAANELNAEQAIVLWINKETNQLGMATYGLNKKLCAEAKVLGDSAYEAIIKKYEELYT